MCLLFRSSSSITVLLMIISQAAIINGFIATTPSSIAQRRSQQSFLSVIEKSITSLDDSTAAVKKEEMEAIDKIESEAELLVQEIIDESCEVDDEGFPADDICIDEVQKAGVRSRLKKMIGNTLRLVDSSNEEDEDADSNNIFEEDTSIISEGEMLERGWEKRGRSSALRRNAEIWKFGLKSVFACLKPRKLRKKGGSEEEVQNAQTEAARFVRDGLLRLGPSFVKLGQVAATRTDVLPATFIDVLKTLQDDVPGFSGERAKRIVSEELGRPLEEIFEDFSDKPLKAASLGQVHTAYYKSGGQRQKVAIKVQRAGLKDLFDCDLKNLKKLAALLDKFDPKTDGADRNWVSIYEESERLLYKEIDYLNEADNAERFANDFRDVDWVRVPKIYRKVSTPRVLTMEFVDSFKLTDIERIEELGLDKDLLAQRTADAFLKQIVETSFFHCDPHPGNLCTDEKGNLVYYDFGMMDELKPNVKSGFRKFCTALFAGGPMIGELDLAKNAKSLVDGVEEAGVLARGADRLAVEKLARYFMRTFKDKQLDKKSSGGIKSTIGADLQTLTENNVFRFPSTFTFVLRAFASVDGIGKGLIDERFDIGRLAQPFVENFTDKKKYSSEAAKGFSIFSKVTGLNPDDINTAVTSPKKIAYIEDTLRSMEGGNLKIRVRSLENEKALERLALSQGKLENLLLASVFLNAATGVASPLIRGVGFVGGFVFALQALMSNLKLKKFDKTQAKYVETQFVDDKESDI